MAICLGWLKIRIISMTLNRRLVAIIVTLIMAIGRQMKKFAWNYTFWVLFSFFWFHALTFIRIDVIITSDFKVKCH